MCSCSTRLPLLKKEYIVDVDLNHTDIHSDALVLELLDLYRAELYRLVGRMARVVRLFSLVLPPRSFSVCGGFRNVTYMYVWGCGGGAPVEEEQKRAADRTLRH